MRWPTQCLEMPGGERLEGGSPGRLGRSYEQSRVFKNGFITALRKKLAQKKS